VVAVSLLSIATQTLTRQRATLGAADPARYGNREWDWTDPDELTLTGFSVQPQAAPEVIDGDLARDSVTTRYLCIGPISDVIATDRIVFAGQTYEVDGDPLVWATGILDHVEFFITRDAG